jgi:hypothetical protein
MKYRKVYSTCLLKRITQVDYCTYGKDGDEELNLDINGDDDEKINHCFKDLNPQELKNVMACGQQHNIHSKIWAVNTFNAWHKL